ncbi:MAG TPA: LysM domain-containing protein [Saprospiraceae bacterium]|nr:LysM domain-containing protein [Saprospiraceae bacterium]
MMRYPILFILLSFSLHISGQSPGTDIPSKKFVHYLDQVGLVLIESLDPGMTLYGLSRKYNVSIDSILAANPDLVPNAIPLGYPVNIPLYPSSISFSPPQVATPEMELFYHVQPKETLYHISKGFLRVDPEIISTLNPGVNQGLSIGQDLRVGWYVPSSIKAPFAATIATAGRDSMLLKPKDYILEAHVSGNKIQEQKGLAVWKPGNVNAHFYVLHPSARVGSYMEITNPMLKRTITAKVAGHIPPGLYQSNVGIVVSPSTARALGALDQQFYARWRYVE